MPAVSAAQERLMQCAAHTAGGCGGVSQSVGMEFIGKDAKASAAGIIFVTPVGNVLFLKRSAKGDHGGEWAFPGGGIEADEEPEDAARREAVEETGMAPKQRLVPLDRRTSAEGVDFSTFVQGVGEHFVPELNDEHVGYAWAPIDAAPEPLHPGVKKLVEALGQNIAKDAEFKESDHPRKDDGKFGSGGGSGHVVAKMTESGKPKVIGVHASSESAAAQQNQILKSAWEKEQKEWTEDPEEWDPYPGSAEAYKEAMKDASGETVLPEDFPHVHEVQVALEPGQTAHVVHSGTHDPDAGVGPTQIHGIFNDPVAAKAAADKVARENWREHGQTYDSAGMPEELINPAINKWNEEHGTSIDPEDVLWDQGAQKNYVENPQEHDDDGEPIPGKFKYTADEVEKAERLGLPRYVDGLNDEVVPYPGLAKATRYWFDQDDHDALIPIITKALVAGQQGANDSGLAFDRDSVRSYDHDGRLHVATTNISKANICPYVGREIPDWQALGLEPDRVYRLLRDPEELAKGAATFNNLPLLSRHVAVTVDDHQPDLVIGSTGTDAQFDAPFLRNSMVIWAASAIEAIESEAQKELSSAYRYRADMTPGTYAGAPYDGVMRDIVGNHVALVKEGRAGTDVVVGDSKQEFLMSKTVLTRKAAMAQGALLVFVKPKLAQDAKLDLTSVLEKITGKNFKESRPAIIAGLKEQTKGKLAKDASIDTADLEKILDVVEALEPMEAEPIKDPNAAVDADGLSPEEEAQYQALMKKRKPAAAADAEETDEEKKAREAKEAKDKTAKDAEVDKDKVTKPAMDAAIAAATKAAEERVLKNQREIRDAERVVRPYVGDLAMAHDSADAVFKTALTTLGVKVDGIHPSAFQAILEMQPKPSTGKPVKVAMDAAGVSKAAKLFPELARIRIQ